MTSHGANFVFNRLTSMGWSGAFADMTEICLKLIKKKTIKTTQQKDYLVLSLDLLA